ncbi:unnamed protein product [Rotaria magnacalcarata]|uniref:Uncharacterized protein n=2 Tax=Rotaria magnacalcarata TaxID=392030 RepID=A0A814WGR9_9BILA|nr:unnamed protein product [Rotaria magnacalcarata]
MATSRITNNVVEKKWNGLPLFVGPFSHRLMGFQLPRLVEQPIPSPVAKSEVRGNIKVDVDTKGKRLANNGPILIVDRRPQQHRLPLLSVDDQDGSDDSLRWQSYDEYYDDDDEEAHDFRSDEQRHEDSESSRQIEQMMCENIIVNKVCQFDIENCVKNLVVTVKEDCARQQSELAELKKQVQIFHKLFNSVHGVVDVVVHDFDSLHQPIPLVKEESKTLE